MSRKPRVPQPPAVPDEIRVFSGPQIDAAVKKWIKLYPDEPLHALARELRISERQLLNWRTTGRPEPGGNAMLRLVKAARLSGIVDLTEPE